MEVQARMKTLTHLPARPAVNIEFKDLSYSVPVDRKGSKVILKNVNGNFKAGQLTAILGPSGAGKSTLLNVLAGLKSAAATGLVTLNGGARDMTQFRHIARYIMQENIMQPYLTVEESMLIAAELKLSQEHSKENKLVAVTEVLDMLNLLKHKNTRTELLSGGEKKRLSIALELVNNPPVIFLDEPTTGLDECAGLQCTSLLKVLAQGGRNVICSIHTPSAKVFAMFDHVYILSEGQCVYQGVGSAIVPFLDEVGLQCPMHYNPTDFIIDVASGEYGCYMDKMVTLTNNGRKSYRTIESQNTEDSSTERGTLPCDVTHLNSDISDYSCSTWKQFKIILYRMYLQRTRDVVTMVMLVVMYIFVAVINALLFQNVGQNAASAFSLYRCQISTMMIHLYCSMIESLLIFPTHIQLIKREHFNRWYNLTAYFWARTVFAIPTQIVYSSAYTAVVFGPTGIPIEFDRMVKFVLICVLLAQISETIGLCIATAMNIVNGLFFGQIVLCPLIILAEFGWGYTEIPTFMQIVIHSDYLHYSLEGLLNAILENRHKIPCPRTEFCLITYTKDLYKMYKMENTNYWIDVAALLVFFVCTKALFLFMLRQRYSPNKTVARLKLVVTFVRTRLSG